MNILFLTQVLPFPLDAGPKTRAYLVLRHLAESGHQVTLVSFTREDDRPEYLEHLRSYCRTIRSVRLTRSRSRDAQFLLQSLVTGRPFLVIRDWTPGMAGAIKAVVETVGPFDAIHVDQLWMAPYGLFARKLAPPGRRPRTVLDKHNAVFNIPRRMAESGVNPLKRLLLNLESRKLARYERSICRVFDRVVWVTEEDRKSLLASGNLPAMTNGSHTVIPISMDLDARQPLRRTPDAHRVTFLGGLHWPPNADGVLWFHKEVWPQVREKLPGAVLTVIGRNPAHLLMNMADPSVEATGYVEVPLSYLAETAVFIVPLHSGGGMRVKILDAWSWGLPVVSTSIGAEGIRIHDGQNLRLADDPASFAAAVIEVVENPQLAENLSVGGRQTLESHYDWRKTYPAWNRIYS